MWGNFHNSVKQQKIKQDSSNISLNYLHCVKYTKTTIPLNPKPGGKLKGSQEMECHVSKWENKEDPPEFSWNHWSRLFPDRQAFSLMNSNVVQILIKLYRKRFFGGKILSKIVFGHDRLSSAVNSCHPNVRFKFKFHLTKSHITNALLYHTKSHSKCCPRNTKRKLFSASVAQLIRVLVMKS